MTELSYHEVTGPVAVIETEDGGSRYLYKGARVPNGVTNLKHLMSVGLVSRVDIEIVETDAVEVVEVVQTANSATPPANPELATPPTNPVTPPAGKGRSGRS